MGVCGCVGFPGEMRDVRREIGKRERMLERRTGREWGNRKRRKIEEK